MLGDKQKAQLEKFKLFSGWMYNDPKVASDAQFLVALGLFNYIETLGAFRIGYLKKDGSGQILKCSYNKGCGGNHKTTSSMGLLLIKIPKSCGAKDLRIKNPSISMLAD